MVDLPLSNDRRMRVDEFDSGKMLGNAAKQATDRGYKNFPIIDVDSHHYELESFNEILEYMPDPVMKQLAQMANSGNSKGVGVMPGGFGYPSQTDVWIPLSLCLVRGQLKKACSSIKTVYCMSSQLYG